MPGSAIRVTPHAYPRPMTDEVLTPAQQLVLDQLRGQAHERPAFDAGLGAELRATLEEALTPVADALDDRLFLNKTRLAQIHGCEAHYLAQLDAPFAWSVPIVKGTVAHKAIELSVHLRGAPTPLDLVDAALDRLGDDLDDRSGIAMFLATLPEAERAELRSEANDLVAKFVDLWPPLRRSWWPTTEPSLRAELCGGAVVVTGKPDLMLGRAVGTQAGRLVVDLKAGGHHRSHLDDLRLYALLETMRCGVPPFRIAGYSLDAGTFQAEDVTVGVLESAVRRTIDGIRKIVEVRTGSRPAAISPNPACTWCPSRATCDGARSWADRDELGLGVTG